MSRIPLSHTGPTTPLSIPGSDIYVQIDTRELEERFAILPRQMAQAAKRAAIRTREWLLTQLTRELAARAAIPKGGLRGRIRRGPKGHDGQFFSDPYAVLWIGLNPLEAQRAGKPRQTKKGTRAGKHFFDRAFTAQIYSGTDKVWRRKGSARFPVIKMTIPINEAMEEILPLYEEPAARMFAQRLEHEVNYLMGLAA